MAKWYAVVKGVSTGIFYKEWDDVKPLVVGFKGAIYSGFGSEGKAQEFFDAGGNVKVEQPKLSFTFDLSKVCRVYVDSCFQYESNSFRLVGAVMSSKGVFGVSAWSWLEDYPELTQMDMDCYAYVNTLKKAYGMGYRDLVIVFKNDCYKGWGLNWKARSNVAKYYKECIGILRNYGCNVQFEKYDYSAHEALKRTVKSALVVENTSEEYEVFGRASSM